MELSNEYKQLVRQAILENRENFLGDDTKYATSLGINKSVYNRIKKGETEKILAVGKWLQIGRLLGVEQNKSDWKVVRTKVYQEIENNILTCQEQSIATMLVDNCGIGKTFSAKHIVKKLRNAFYVDCSQAKSKILFIKTLARTIGIETTGRYVDIKEDLKYYLNQLKHTQPPVVVLDEFGDLEYTAFLEIKEIMNATYGRCGWFAMGANALRTKIENGIKYQKVGFEEIFDRFSDEFVRLTPTNKEDKELFYKELLTQVATANYNENSDLSITQMVNICINKEGTLRKLETLIKISA